jgi:hypothetical protein
MLVTGTKQFRLRRSQIEGGFLALSKKGTIRITNYHEDIPK